MRLLVAPVATRIGVVLLWVETAYSCIVNNGGLLMEQKNQEKKKCDDRDWVPVSDLDEELDLPLVREDTKKPTKLSKMPEKNLGYR
jgi:hypothetical protein